MRKAIIFPLLLVFSCLVALPSAMARQPISEVRVDFTADALTSQYAHGLADRSTGRAVGIDDPVRIASISKLVLAIGLLRLVEE